MKRYFLIQVIIILTVGLLIYGQSFGFGFVFDDHLFIVGNPFIKNLSNFHRIWHEMPLTRFLGILSFALNYHFNQMNPYGYHVFNVIIHLVNTFLVWALADSLFKLTFKIKPKQAYCPELPFFVALLFLVHPCQTQAVCYITQRFESMATFFYLAAVYTYLHARLSTQVILQCVLFTLVFILALAGIMTKEVVVTLPMMLLVIEWIFFQKKQGVWVRVGWLVIIAGILILLMAKFLHTGLNLWQVRIPSDSHDGDKLTAYNYLLTQARVLLTFLRLFILPINQNLDYDYPASIGFLHPPLTLLGFMVIGSMIYLIIKWRQAYPLRAFGLAWVLITFSINLVPRANVIFEHKMYLISFGFFVFCVACLPQRFYNSVTWRKIMYCLIAVYACMSFGRNKVWSNEILLWEDCIKHSPNKARVNANLGRVYGSNGDIDRSIDYLTRALALKPDCITYENRSVNYALKGLYAKALDDLNMSMKMDPTFLAVYLKRAWVYDLQGNDKAAFADLDRIIKIDPYFGDAYYQRAIFWEQKKKYQEAMSDYQEILKLEPLNVLILTKLGVLEMGLKHYDLAVAYFDKALKIGPIRSETIKYKNYCLTQIYPARI